MRRFVLGSIRFVAGVLLLSLAWSLFYLGHFGLPRVACDRIEEEIRKAGVDLSVGRLTFDPVRGLVARELRVLDREDPAQEVARIDRVRLAIDFARMIRHQPFLDGIELERANLSVPVGKRGSGEPPLVISGLDARVLFPPGQIVVARAGAELLGVKIVARGSLSRPGEWAKVLPAGIGRGEGEGDMLPGLLASAREIRFPAGAPTIDIRIGGDCGEPESVTVEVAASAKEIAGPSFHLTEFALAMALRDRTVTLRELSCRDRIGSAVVRGSMDLRGTRLIFEGASGLDLEPIIRKAGGKWLRECVFYGPPSLAFSGEYDLVGGQLSAMGSARFGRFAVRSVIFEGASADFRVLGGDWFLSDLKVRHRSGEIGAEAISRAGSFRGALEAAIDPDELRPLADGKVLQMMSEWEFDDVPRVELKISGASSSPEAGRVEGKLALGKARFRGLPIRSVTSAIVAEDGAVSYDGFRVEREEGVATGRFDYDFKDQEVRLSGVKSTLNPKDVAVWIDPRMVKDIAPYRFKKPPYAEVEGKVDLTGGESTDLRVDVSAPQGLLYRFINKDIDVGQASARFHLLGQTLFLKKLDGTLMGGRVGAEAAISVKPGDPTYKASVQVRDVDFPSITKLYFNYDEASGRLHGKYDFTGSGPDAQTMRGRGTAEVIEGNVFAIPIFGPLSGILNTIIPGLGYNVAKRASASYEIRDGTISTRDFLVEGRGFSMIGGGDLYFLRDAMKFDIRINAQGLPGAILFPVSKLFEYRSEGKMSKPVWNAKILPIL